jgi:hypothetical protein
MSLAKTFKDIADTASSPGHSELEYEINRLRDALRAVALEGLYSYTVGKSKLIDPELVRLVFEQQGFLVTDDEDTFTISFDEAASDET